MFYWCPGNKLWINPF